jgi:hypothetical protein
MRGGGHVFKEMFHVVFLVLASGFEDSHDPIAESANQCRNETGAIVRITSPRGVVLSMEGNRSLTSMKFVAHLEHPFCKFGCEVTKLDPSSISDSNGSSKELLLVLKAWVIPTVSLKTKLSAQRAGAIRSAWKVTAEAGAPSIVHVQEDLDNIILKDETEPHEYLEFFHELELILLDAVDNDCPAAISNPVDPVMRTADVTHLWTAPRRLRRTTLLYHHLGLGDHLVCAGLVRRLAASVPLLFVAVDAKYLASLVRLFHGLNNVHPVSVHPLQTPAMRIPSIQSASAFSIFVSARHNTKPSGGDRGGGGSTRFRMSTPSCPENRPTSTPAGSGCCGSGASPPLGPPPAAGPAAGPASGAE